MFDRILNIRQTQDGNWSYIRRSGDVQDVDYPFLQAVKYQLNIISVNRSFSWNRIKSNQNSSSLVTFSKHKQTCKKNISKCLIFSFVLGIKKKCFLLKRTQYSTQNSIMVTHIFSLGFSGISPTSISFDWSSPSLW